MLSGAEADITLAFSGSLSEAEGLVTGQDSLQFNLFDVLQIQLQLNEDQNARLNSH